MDPIFIVAIVGFVIGVLAGIEQSNQTKRDHKLRDYQIEEFENTHG